MSLINFSNNTGIIESNVKCKLTFNYSDINLNLGYEQTMNKFFITKETSPNDNILLFDYAYKNADGYSLITRGKYQVTKIHFSRSIHKNVDSSSHDFEMIIQNELYSEEDQYNSVAGNRIPIRYVYQVFIFKNNKKKPTFINMNDVTNATKRVNLNVNKVLDIHKKNNAFPSVYFLRRGELANNLFPKTNEEVGPVVFVWRVPINDYKISNYDKILTKCDSNESNLQASLDWGAIFTNGSIKISSDVVTYVTNSLPSTKNQLLFDKLYTNNSTTLLYTISTTTDDIYIDCAPINESVDRVNHYLQKLNGNDDSTKKKVMEMVTNSLIMLVVSGSVFFTAPTICEFFLKNVYSFVVSEQNGYVKYWTAPIYIVEMIVGGILFIITIILLGVGGGKKKKGVLLAGLFFALILGAFIFSVGNSNKSGILKGYLTLPAPSVQPAVALAV